MAKQMTLDERKRIDFLLQLGWTPVQIAKEMGRSKTTIIREIINRSVACDRGYRCSNRICANFDVCSRPKGYGANPNRLFRCTAGAVQEALLRHPHRHYQESGIIRNFRRGLMF